LRIEAAAQRYTSRAKSKTKNSKIPKADKNGGSSGSRIKVREIKSKKQRFSARIIKRLSHKSKKNFFSRKPIT
jgi:hypothetical protein